MQDRLYGWKYTGWVLALAYLCTVFCFPWLNSAYSYYRAVNQQHSNSGEEPAHSVLALSEKTESPAEAAKTQQKIERCAKVFACRVVDYRAIRMADVATDDPVALFTVFLAISTIGLWFQTWVLAKRSESQSDDIQTELAIARDDFISTHRPWVGFSAKIGNPGIKVDANGITFTLVFTCKNTGTTPAIGASINAKAYLWDPLEGLVARQTAICLQMSAPLSNPQAGGKSLFPGDQDVFTTRFNVPRADADAFADNNKDIFVVVSGCVDYAFSFGDACSHQSGFIYYLGKRRAGVGFNAKIVLAEGDIPLAEVYMEKAYIAGAFFAT